MFDIFLLMGRLLGLMMGNGMKCLSQGHN